MRITIRMYNGKSLRYFNVSKYRFDTEAELFSIEYCKHDHSESSTIYFPNYKTRFASIKVDPMTDEDDKDDEGEVEVYSDSDYEKDPAE